MRDTVIKILKANLKKIQKYIDEHNESLAYVLKYPRDFHKGAEEVLRDKIKVADIERVELLDSIKWVKQT